MNSEVDLTKQCYQIWQKVAKVAQKCYQKWQKVAKVAKKCQKWRKGFYHVQTTRAWPPLSEAGPKARRRRQAQGPKGPELVSKNVIIIVRYKSEVIFAGYDNITLHCL